MEISVPGEAFGVPPLLTFSGLESLHRQVDDRRFSLSNSNSSSYFVCFNAWVLERKKGFSTYYVPGINCSPAAQPQKSRLGEPHECCPLYRIGPTQEDHQLLHQDGGTDKIVKEGTRSAAKRSVFVQLGRENCNSPDISAMEATIFGALGSTTD